ncbi:MAG: hypothetical protein J0I17_09970 ['Candidatus Kapabacteria' thiocyanatum]|uniref:Uncharacterized protein n=1 Tax=Candidatus Kapaibacterium thiocyanatum TaxID=1895771 RepID=A0A1M3KVJ4_9BACT|nr:hypothetical protein ['Candidatus Kapabacteria' thiocyanatum]OJX56246.1 MAG: hypothetical protein BGO89_12970 ['Candidatus Kapabacteria' thiocyanatum]
MTDSMTIASERSWYASVAPSIYLRYAIVMTACLLSTVVPVQACPTCTTRNDGVMQSLTHGSDPTSVIDILLVIVMLCCVLWSAIATVGAISGEKKRRKQVQQGHPHEAE